MSEMYDETCITCGVEFCLPLAQHERLYRTKENFYCPSGHSQHYTGETFDKKEQRLKNKIKAQEQTINYLREDNTAACDRIGRLRKQIRSLKIARGRWRGIAIRLKETDG